MKYEVRQLSYRVFLVEKETGEEYIVAASSIEDSFSKLSKAFEAYNLTFRCTCPYNTIYNKDCKHIRFVKEYIVTGKEVFEEEGEESVENGV